MSIIYNNKDIESVKYNGNSIDKVNYNGTEVFTSGHKLTVTIGNNISNCTCMGKNYYSTFTLNIPKDTAVTLSCTPKSTTYSSYTYNPSTASTNPKEDDIRTRYYYTYTRQWSGDYVSSSNYNNFTMPDNDVNISVSATQNNGVLQTEKYVCSADGSYSVKYEKVLNYLTKYGGNYIVVAGYKADLSTSYDIIESNPKLRNFTLLDLKNALGTNNVIIRFDFTGGRYHLDYDDGDKYKSVNRFAWEWYPQKWYTSEYDLKTNYYDRNIFPIPYDFEHNRPDSSGDYIGGYFRYSEFKDGISTYTGLSRAEGQTGYNMIYYRHMWINDHETDFNYFFGSNYNREYIYIPYLTVPTEDANELFNTLRASTSPYSNTYSTVDDFMGYTGEYIKNTTFFKNPSYYSSLSGAFGAALNLLDSTEYRHLSIFAKPTDEFRLLVYPAKSNTQTITKKGSTMIETLGSYIGSSDDYIIYAPIVSVASNSYGNYALPSTAYDLELPSGASSDVYLTTSLPKTEAAVKAGVPIRNFQQGSSYKVSNYKYICTIGTTIGVNYKFTCAPEYVPDVDESSKKYKWISV